MKKPVLAILAFFAFTSLAAAQEKHTADRQPPVITQQQVERDEKQAQEQRKKLEEERRAQLEKQKREERTRVTDNINNRTATKKTSTHTGEQ